MASSLLCSRRGLSVSVSAATRNGGNLSRSLSTFSIADGFNFSGRRQRTDSEGNWSLQRIRSRGAGGGSRRHYTPMTPADEEEEKKRVAALSEFQRDQELRQLNRQIAKLEILRGINTGERYTWSGRYKALARDYGMPLVAWYWAVWGTTAVMCYGLIQIGGVDAMALIQKVDVYMGWELATRVDPNLGQIGLAIVVNELLEPLRLPVVIVTVKPVIDRLFPPKY